MNKEPSKTEKIIFDADFDRLLSSGDRHAYAECRNFIIDELKKRAQRRSAITQFNEVQNRTIQEIGRAKSRKVIAMLIYLVLIAANIWIIILNFEMQKYLMGILMVALLFINLANALKLFFETSFFSAFKKIISSAEMEIVISEQNYPSQYQKIFEQISSDSEEILNAKKSALDGALGF